jgi:prolyl-tRNA synthetase
MRMSQLFIQTLREAPSEARTPGFQFLVRAGLVRSLGGGCALLPLGIQARRRIETALCNALQDAGAQPVAVPLVRSAEQAGVGGRDPDNRLVRFRDRAQREMMLESGHEASILTTAAAVIQSYRQLPATLFEIWQQYRDEERQAGGLLGAREGRVLDVYGLHADAAALTEGYQHIREVLTTAYAPCRVAAREVIAAEDATGQTVAHKLIYTMSGGEETVARCDACGYAAEPNGARVSQEAPSGETPLPMQDVETPACKTIAELANFLGIPTAHTAKAVFLVAHSAGADEYFVFAVVRGDTALNEGKLKAVLNAETVGPATEAEIRQAGAEPGYGSPVGLSGITIVVDQLVTRSPNLVAGANRPGYHTLNVNYGRDYQATIVADIAMAQDGSPCPNCGRPLTLEQGVTLAEMWQPGDQLAQALAATYLDGEGRGRPLALSRYRVYLDRFLAAVAETHYDEHGLLWPWAITPYHVYLMTLGKMMPEVTAAAERLYAELARAGVSVLYDDRDERAGVKFNDADLIGAPLRVAVGDRGLKVGTVEVKRRGQTEVQQIPVDGLLSHATDVLASAPTSAWVA